MTKIRSGMRAGDESAPRFNARVEKVYYQDSQTGKSLWGVPHKEDFHEKPIRVGFLRDDFQGRRFVDFAFWADGYWAWAIEEGPPSRGDY
jgi:hypothetical protein